MSLTIPVKEIVDGQKNPLLSIHPSWARVDLGHISSIQNGAAFKSSLFTKDKGMPLVRIRDVGSDITECFYDGDYDDRYIVKSGDLLVGMDGDFRASRWTGPRALLNQRVCKVDLTTELYEPGFLDLVLPGYLNAIKDQTSSVTVTHLSSRDMTEIPLPLPPHAEQKRIVARVEEVMAHVNSARERLAKMPTILKRFRQSVRAAACSGRLTADWRRAHGHSDEGDDLPTNWKSATIGEVIDSLKYGTAQKCDYSGKGVPVLRIPNIGDGVIDRTDLKYATLEHREFEQLRLRRGDVLMIRSNGSVSLLGKAALVRAEDEDSAYAGYLIRLRPKSEVVLPEYLNLVLGSFEVRLQIELPARSTSGVNNINSDEVRALPLNLPPREEQAEIIRRMENVTAFIKKIEAKVLMGTRRADKLVQATLSKAFRGELVPTEAELAHQEGRGYESATHLLERIHKLQPVGQIHSKPVHGSSKANDHRENLFETPPHPADKKPQSKKSKEPKEPKETPAEVGGEISYDEAMSYLRDAFAEGGARDREQAIRALARTLGYERVGSRVREAVDRILRLGVRRGILGNDDGQYRLLVRSAADYTIDHLIDTLLASVDGTWTPREDAIRATAQHLGFKKAGPAFRDQIASAINGAIRRKKLEYDGDLIRKVH